MKSNLLQYYLNWNVKCYVLIILGISCLIVYVQQEYIICLLYTSDAADE